MTTMIDRTDPGGVLPTRGPRLRAARENEMTLLSQNLSRTRIPETAHVPDEIVHMPDEVAARVRAMRRARREARTRASRVRRVLLAPTARTEYRD
ncbi:hypothetical protein ABZ806_05585 [Spirillospora sp. NPDC047418]